MQLNKEQFLSKLRGHIASKYRTQTNFANKLGISRSMVSSVVTGEKEPTKAMLDDLNVTREIVFIEK